MYASTVGISISRNIFCCTLSMPRFHAIFWPQRQFAVAQGHPFNVIFVALFSKTLIEKIFRQIKYLVISLVNKLVSRNFASSEPVGTFLSRNYFDLRSSRTRQKCLQMFFVDFIYFFFQFLNVITFDFKEFLNRPLSF